MSRLSTILKALVLGAALAGTLGAPTALAADGTTTPCPNPPCG